MGDHEKPGGEENDMFTKKFWMDTCERTISSAAQGAATGWGLTVVFTSVDDVVTAGQAAGFGALSMGVLTFLKCLIAANVNKQTDVPVTPSFVDTKAA